MLFVRVGYKASTGALQLDLPHACGRCGARTTARVACEGWGTSSGLWGIGASASEARARAHESAAIYARSAVHSVACPGCGALPPMLDHEIETARRRARRRHALALPVAGAAAIVVAALFAPFAVRDLAHSPWLAVGATSLALCAAAAIAAALVWPRSAPTFKAEGIAFWWRLRNGAMGWVPARPPVLPPEPPRTSQIAHAVALVAAIASGSFALAGFGLWSTTFAKVYVVDAGSPAKVRVDGELVPTATDTSYGDAAVRSVTVRTGQSHRIELDDGDGRSRAYAITPNRYGWVIAPHGRARDLCIVEEKRLYGKSKPSEYAFARLDEGGDSFGLPRIYQDVFAESPKQVQPSGDQTSASRWTLRAVSCAALARRELKPYRPAARSGELRAERD